MTWKPGQSGNPLGRQRNAIDISALARQSGPRCIAVLNDLLEDPSDPRVRYMAAQALLDRGFGKAPQLIEGAEPGTLTMLHLIAARQVAEQMQALLAAGVKPDSFNGNGKTNGHSNGNGNGHDRTIDGVAIDYTKPALE